MTNDFHGEPDDDEIAALLKNYAIPALTDTKFVVTVTFEAHAILDEIGALLTQYKLLKDVPGTDQSKQEILFTLEDVADTLKQSKGRFIEDIKNIPTMNTTATEIWSSGLPINITVTVDE